MIVRDQLAARRGQLELGAASAHARRTSRALTPRLGLRAIVGACRYVRAVIARRLGLPLLALVRRSLPRSPAAAAASPSRAQRARGARGRRARQAERDPRAARPRAADAQRPPHGCGRRSTRTRWRPTATSSTPRPTARAFWKRIERWYVRRGRRLPGRSARTCSGRRRGVDPSRAIDLWMNSPEHRANILTPRWREIGVAAVHVDERPGRLRRPAGDDHHHRLRRPPLAAVGATLRRRARSSVEERRPSKPLVGGSNPPGRITRPSAQARVPARP